MGFFSRLYNLWKGFLSVFVAARRKAPWCIRKDQCDDEKYAKLKSAAGLIKHRAKLKPASRKLKKNSKTSIFKSKWSSAGTMNALPSRKEGDPELTETRRRRNRKHEDAEKRTLSAV